MTLEFWLKVGEWVIPPVITAFLEYKFGIIGRLKKIWYYIKNENAGFEINLTFKKGNDFEKIKKEFITLTQKKFNGAPIKKNNPTKLEIQTDNYLTTLNYTPNKEVFISTTRIECGIRNLKNKLSTFLGIIKDLRQNSNLISKEASFKIFIPFKWSYINIRTPKGLKLNDYDVKFNEKEFNSIINLKMNTLSISGDETSLGYIMDNFISIF
jgi:hypothetical protein